MSRPNCIYSWRVQVSFRSNRDPAPFHKRPEAGSGTFEFWAQNMDPFAPIRPKFMSKPAKTDPDPGHNLAWTQITAYPWCLKFQNGHRPLFYNKKDGQVPFLTSNHLFPSIFVSVAYLLSHFSFSSLQVISPPQQVPNSPFSYYLSVKPLNPIQSCYQNSAKEDEELAKSGEWPWRLNW